MLRSSRQSLTPYEAERRGRTGNEDRLTSRFFGHLSRLDAGSQKGFFDTIGLKLNTIKNVELWKSVQDRAIGLRELDVWIETDDGIIIVENKLGSEFDVDQLIEEYKLASQTNPKTRMMCISQHLVRPREVADAENRIGTSVVWTSWSRCLSISRTLLQEPNLQAITKQNLADLVTFMESQGLAPQVGFSKEDDWKEFFRLYENSRELFSHVKSVLADSGFKSEHDEQDYGYGDEERVVYWGRSYYRYPSGKDRQNEENDYGYVADIGIFHGIPKLRFGVYVPAKLEKQGKAPGNYFRTQVGKPAWVQDYVLYSRFLPIADLKSLSLDEQLKEVTTFLNDCVSETKPLLPT